MPGNPVNSRFRDSHSPDLSRSASPSSPRRFRDSRNRHHREDYYDRLDYQDRRRLKDYTDLDSSDTREYRSSREDRSYSHRERQDDRLPHRRRRSRSPDSQYSHTSRREHERDLDSRHVPQSPDTPRRQSPARTETPRGILKQTSTQADKSERVEKVRFSLAYEDYELFPTDSPTIQSERDLFAEDEDALIEKRRKARALVKARYQAEKGSGVPLSVQAMTNNTAALSPDIPDSPMTPSVDSGRDSPPAQKPDDPQDIPSPSNAQGESPEGPSAADYDPLQEEIERQLRQANAADHDETTEVMQIDHPVPVPNASNEKRIVEEDDDDDMFALSDLPEGPVKKGDLEMVKTVSVYDRRDDCDDEEGYFKVVPNSLVSHRYIFLRQLGKGVFANVVRAWDKGAEYATAHETWKKTHPDSKSERDFSEPKSTAQKQVMIAIKIVRKDDYMARTARKEIDVLKELCPTDEPDNHRHIVRLHGTFIIRDHQCIAFENMHASLRTAMGEQKGKRFKMVQICDYARQLMDGLAYLREHELLHADLKPDNILIDERMQTVKIADLGSALKIFEVEKAPELVSRFYRPPEVILGIPYDYAIDVWSIGCTLYELLTGTILFWEGESNNGMIRVIQQVRGRFPSKLAKKGFFYLEYFDETGQHFRSVTKNYTTATIDTKYVRMPERPQKDVKSRVLGTKRKDDEGKTEEDIQMRTLFVDFLDKCLDVNPERRITAPAALKHPFVQMLAPPPAAQQLKPATVVKTKPTKQAPVKVAPGFRTIV